MRQTLPYPTLILLHKLDHRCKRLADENLARHGITLENVKLLHMLINCDGGMIAQKQLEATLDVRRSSVTSMLQTLERRGLIVRSTEEGSREKTVTLTDAGRELENELGAYITVLHQTVFKGFSPPELDNFADYLSRALENTMNTEENFEKTGKDITGGNIC